MNEELEGLPVVIGYKKNAKTFIVPPMSIGAAKRSRADRDLLNDPKQSDDEKMLAATRVIWLSVLRNYPDLKIEEIEERLTLGNFSRILMQVVKAWRFDPEDGEPKKEAKGK
jgi:hypothetical protein